ncbi:MAG: DUF2155 domain-containing protein [Roseicyclus sp.]|jgi:hypothetical protein
MIALRLIPALAALVLAPLAAGAQQFDNFGDGSLDGFQLDLEGAEGLEVPSLGDEGGLVLEGPDISLDLNGGQSDAGFITLPGTGTPVTSVSQPATTQSNRVTLRALDRTLGRPTDVDLAIGETVVFGRIAINAVECRYPTGDPSSDAFAHVEILDTSGVSLFDGWMIASSPALNALEHPRYDVWVLRCATE